MRFCGVPTRRDMVSLLLPALAVSSSVACLAVLPAFSSDADDKYVARAKSVIDAAVMRARSAKLCLASVIAHSTHAAEEH